MSKIVTPHDRFFRAAMTDIRVAKEFFEYHLSPLIKEHLEWDSLTLCPTSYIDKSLKLSASDILYRATIAGQDAYIYLLAEHQSEAHKLMPFRIWQYILSIQADHQKQNKSDTLPLVYPLVFYHGHKAYPYSTDIRDLIAAPADLVEQVFFKPFHLIDTHALADEDLKRLHWAGVMEFMMKHIFARDVLPYLKQIIGILRDLEKADGTDYIVTMLNYVLVAGETASPEEFVETLKKELPAVEEKVMTIAEMLIEKAKQTALNQGINQGVQKSRHEIAIRLLQAGQTPQYVANITGLSLEEIDELQFKTNN
jgi:predicted transposase/invertase (TIGR01784 family)